MSTQKKTSIPKRFTDPNVCLDWSIKKLDEAITLMDSDHRKAWDLFIEVTYYQLCFGFAESLTYLKA